MNEKSTNNLEQILRGTRPDGFGDYLRNNRDSMVNESADFFVYCKELFRMRGRSQQDVFLDGGIPERYGYKLLAGEKRTRQRDVILRICFAGHLTLRETQRALRKYEMPELYAKIKRDALLMIAFNERIREIPKVDALLTKEGLEPLRSCGEMD